MLDNSKEQFILQVAEDLINKFDANITSEVIDILNIHLNDYEIHRKLSPLSSLDEKTSNILKIFIGSKKLEGRSENTLKQYYREIRLCLDFLQCPIDEVTASGVKTYLTTMKMERNLQNSTLENMRQYLNAVFSWAVNEELIQKNPIKKIAPIKCEYKVRPSFNQEEMKIIKDYCKDNLRNFALINFLYSTGCRVSEICSVNIQDIDFNNNQLIVLGKGNKQRTVFLNNEAVESLKNYLRTRTDNCKALFLSNKKKRITDSGIRHILKTIEEKTGVKDIHPHRFRRTLATDLLDKGMGIQNVAFILGHSNISTTQKYNYQTTEKIKSEFNKHFQ